MENPIFYHIKIKMLTSSNTFSLRTIKNQKLTRPDRLTNLWQISVTASNTQENKKTGLQIRKFYDLGQVQQLETEEEEAKSSLKQKLEQKTQKDKARELKR